RRNIELTDFHKFLDIKTALIEAIGVGVVGAQREPQSASRKPRYEACNNYRCAADAGRCRCPHVCNICKLAGNKGPDC
ncbi:hypothetical protein B0H13DRAFT_1576581, partial [Mycena leptocephala]